VLAFEPFFQQILTYPDRTVPVGQSLIWTARSFLPGHTSILRIPRNTYADPSMSAAIDGASNTPEISIRLSTATCFTGNCTWPLYPTLSVCHDCQDVSHLLEYFCKNHTSLDIAAVPRGALDPCGFRVNNTFVVGLDGDLGLRQATSLSTVFVDTFNASLTFGGPFWNTTTFSNCTLPIADFYIGYTPGGPPAVLRNETPLLVERLLSWCAKTLEARFENGSLKESVVGTITIQPDTMDETGSSPVVAVLGSNATFTIVNQSTQNLRDWILSNLPPVLSQDSNFPFVSDVGMWQFHQVPPYDLDGYFSNLTTAITNDMESRVAWNGACRRYGLEVGTLCSSTMGMDNSARCFALGKLDLDMCNGIERTENERACLENLNLGYIATWVVQRYAENHRLRYLLQSD
jgi:hypothetical protein